MYFVHHSVGLLEMGRIDCELTLHSQPNSHLFENFDRLLLLQRGGETVYFGDIGKDACVSLLPFSF